VFHQKSIAQQTCYDVLGEKGSGKMVWWDYHHTVIIGCKQNKKYL